MAKTGHPNFDYTCQGLWRGLTHNFSITGNHSGSSFGAADAKTFMEGDQSPYCLSFAPFQATDITVVGARYYDGQNSAPVYEATYNTENPAPDPLTATGEGLVGGAATGIYMPLECCVMLEAVVGTSKNNKPVYCRKYLRGGPYGGITQEPSGEVQWGISTAGTAAAKAMGDGSWYNSRVYISPSARSAIGTWEVLPQVGNHQVPRGRKRSLKTQGSSIVKTIENALNGLPGFVPVPVE